MKKMVWLFVIMSLLVMLLPVRPVFASGNAYSNMQSKEPTPSIRDEILKYDDSNGYVTVDGSRMAAGIWDAFWQTYVVVKSILPIIIGVSIIIGAIFVMCARRNKGFRRTCIIMFIITIPLLSLLYVYGIPSMKELFQTL